MSELVFVAVERSSVGETVFGVFSSLEAARARLPPLSSGRLEDYRIEAHVLDEPPDVPLPWQIAISRDGNVLAAAAATFCACDDDDAHFRSNSFIERGGESMHLVVLAKTPGQAIAAAGAYRSWLVENGLWDAESPVEPIYADT